MPDIAFRMRDVRWVSGIVSGIDLMYAGAISVPEMQNIHLCRFSMYLSTKWYPKEMLDITFQMRDVRWVSSIISGIEFVYAGAIYMARIDHLYQWI